jgi:hypothetical protein
MLPSVDAVVVVVVVVVALEGGCSKMRGTAGRCGKIAVSVHDLSK